MISGQEDPDGGNIRVGDTVSLGYVDQSRAELDGDKTVWEEISDGLDEVDLGHRTMQSRAYVSQFNFRGADQQKKVGQLSGGERNRVHLAKVLKAGANVVLLDEPTNDLDVDTLRALEAALLDFPDVQLWSAMIAGSWTGLPLTFWRLRARATLSGLREIMLITRKTGSGGWA